MAVRTLNDGLDGKRKNINHTLNTENIDFYFLDNIDIFAFTHSHRIDILKEI